MITTLLYFFIGHVIADFYAQSETMARDKKTDQRALNAHIIIYAVIIILLGLLTFNVSYIFLAVVLSAVHAVIDYLKFNLTHKQKLSKQQNIKIFAFDQFLHIASITGIILIASAWLAKPDIWQFLSTELNVAFTTMLQWLLVILVIIKPASIVIRMTLGYFEPKEVADNNPGIIQAGEFIGILERLTILILLGAQAYAAIGFVITAKSIARYNKIAEEPKFAEYYLIGTLMSALIVLTMYHIIF